MKKNRPETIAVLDYGSQYTQLIARRIREIKVYCSIHPFNRISEDLLNYITKLVI